MLFNPLRQIADKFNEMQLGMIALTVFWDYWYARSNTRYRKIEASLFAGNISFKDSF
jgi:hypothetical protein